MPMPLGDAWSGLCRADADQPFTPDDRTAIELCNMGYARGRCSRYPQGDAADAVRFVIARDQDACVRIHYVMERGHHPYLHGVLEYSRVSNAFADPPANPALAVQAQAYVASYLRRRPAVA
jgi:hypothetical protein